MTQKDLQQIKQLLEENNKNLVTKNELKKILEENNKILMLEFANFVDNNLLPTMETMIDEKIRPLQQSIDCLDERVSSLHASLNRLETKADKLDKRENEDAMATTRKIAFLEKSLEK